MDINTESNTKKDPQCFKHCTILEGNGLYADVGGYTFSRLKWLCCLAGYVLTIGMLRLIFYWMPHWGLKCTHRACSLIEAQMVLVKDPFGICYTYKVKMSFAHGVVESGKACSTGVVKFDHNDSHIYFLHKKLKYVWDFSLESFVLLSGWEERPVYKIVPAKPLTPPEVYDRQSLYDRNEIQISLTPIIQILLKQSLSPIYVFQLFSCILWFAEDYWKYSICIVILSVLSLSVQTYEIHRNEVSLRKTICFSSSVAVFRSVDGAETQLDISSTELVPGDVIEIPHRGCMMQCDALLLTGNCIVNESTLTGESVPITKIPFVHSSTPEEVFKIDTSSRHVLFGGTMVIQTRNYADQRVLAIVLRTGYRTTKGELVRSILFPKPVKFKFTQDAFKFIGALACLALFGFALSFYFMYTKGEGIQYMMLHSLDVITVVVPPALPLAMTVGVLFAQSRLKKNGIFCINSSAVNVCGVINLTCFDKTGTLTEEGLDLWGVLPVSEGQFDNPESDPSRMKCGPLLECMASCHSLTLIEGVLSGDPLDLKMFQSTQWEFTEEVSEDHCKFEMAIPVIVRPNPQRSMTNITVETMVDAEVPYEVGVLRQFPFSSSLQRMSVIARVTNSQHFSIYSKGAPETIEALCRPDTVPSDFHSTLMEYTLEGYRVLALAWRPLKSPYNRIMRASRDRLEQDLLFLGFLVMENRLKPESTPVIQTLRGANIRPVMVTGDNMLTAVSVARDCEMIAEPEKIIIVSAKPPPKLLEADNLPLQSPANGDVMDGKGELAAPVATSDRVLLRQASLESPNGGIGCGGQVPAEAGVDGKPVVETDEPLVEFHYAEDLHKLVTEVTTTTAVRREPLQSRNATGGSSWLSNWLPRRRMKQALRTMDATAGRRAQPTLNQTSLHSSPILTVPVYFPNELGFLSQQSGQQPDPAPPASPSHKVNIRMLDRPDFHLALSGKTWSVIREHYPWLIPKIVVKGTIFARFSPDQKAQLVESLQSVGYYVAMCGDGANDCGALKAAHAGVALSEAEASVASPFTSNRHDISCIPTLIKDGRCALVTSFGIFKFMAGYSMVQFITVLLLQSTGSNITDGQFLYIDLFLITALSITFGYTRPFPRLALELPPIRLLSVTTLLSLGLQILVALAVQLFAFFFVRGQPWFIPHVIGEDEYVSTESTAIFIVASYQYIILAIVFSKGAPYRSSMFSNYYFTVNVFAWIVATVYVTIYPCSWLLAELEMIRLPSMRFILILQGVALANFFVSLLLEMIVDGVQFRRRLAHVRRILFPRYVPHKDYELIREEIDRMAGNWPRIIHSASVQALPRELFAECDRSVLPPERTRTWSRCVSNISDTDEDVELGHASHHQHHNPVMSGLHPEALQEEKAGRGGVVTVGKAKERDSRRRRTFSDGLKRRHSVDDEAHRQSIRRGHQTPESLQPRQPVSTTSPSDGTGLGDRTDCPPAYTIVLQAPKRQVVGPDPDRFRSHSSCPGTTSGGAE